jgi:uncharacterized protein YdeI (YjbR/CyaY-like superfamily)
MDKQSFVGIGKNPDPNVSDIPLGLGMELIQNTAARTSFENLSDQEKNNLISYLQKSKTGNEAKDKVKKSINNLAMGDTSFF